MQNFYFQTNAYNRAFDDAKSGLSSGSSDFGKFDDNYRSLYSEFLQAAEQNNNGDNADLYNLFAEYCALRFELSSAEVHLKRRRLFSDEETALIRQDLKLLAAGMPPQRVLAKAWFYGDLYYLNKACLIPRFDSEILVTRAYEDIKAYGLNEPEHKRLRIIDLCCGSGCLGIALTKNLLAAGIDCRLTAIDISLEALEAARFNAEKYLPKLLYTFVSYDLLKAKSYSDISRKYGKFDIIIANPPYIAVYEEEIRSDLTKYDPKKALIAGEGGMQFYNFFKNHLPEIAACGGARAYFEIGSSMSEKITDLLPSALIINDLAGRPRVAVSEFSAVYVPDD